MDRSFRLGPWRITPELNQVERGGTVWRLEPKIMQVLVCLSEANGSVVSKERLFQKVWPDTFVTEDVLKRSISELRRVFGDDARKPQVIETIAKGGYRLLCPVVPDALPAAVPENGRRSTRFLWGARGAGFLGLALVGLGFMRGRAPAAPVTLLVMPMENLGHDPQAEYFADGLTEDLITEFSRLYPRLRVIGRASAMRYKGSGKTVRELGTETGVAYVLQSSVRRDRDHVRITAQLVQVRDEAQVWGNTYDANIGNLLQTQAEVSRAVANELSLRLVPSRANSTRVIADVRVHDAFLEGRYYLRRYGRGDLEKSKPFFEQAIALDPNFAPAYAGLATYYLLRAVWDRPPREVMPKAEQAALKAIELDPELADGHVALAQVRLRYSWDWQAAEREVKRALELNPGLAEAHDVYCEVLGVVGRLDEALAEAKLAFQLEPLWAEMAMEVGAAYEGQHRYDEAIGMYRRALELDPQNGAGAMWAIGEVYREKGMPKETFEWWDKFWRASGLPERADLISNAYRTQGGDAAMKLFLTTALQRRFDAMTRGERVPPVNLADLYARLGDKDKAFAYLDKAIEERSFQLPFLKTTGVLEPLHSDPRYAKVLQRVGLP